jgi:3-methylfumaryl-CoA hydratase
LNADDYRERERIEQDEVSLSMCRRLAALLDIDPATVNAGDALPAPWAAILFPEVARQSQIGGDGHPLRGEFLPPIPLPRRRFAGREIEWFAPLTIGDAVSRRSTIADVVDKSGRNGPMTFVTILHEISTATGLAYTERQNVVYLGPPAEGAGAAPRKPDILPVPEWTETVEFDPVMLFRYSALTFNGHRIHYDRDYAMSKEGYRDLVVNGGLTSLFLLELARRKLAVPIRSYQMRALSVVLAGRPVQLCGRPTAEGAELWAVDSEGTTLMKIEVQAG